MLMIESHVCVVSLVHCLHTEYMSVNKATWICVAGTRVPDDGTNAARPPPFSRATTGEESGFSYIHLFTCYFYITYFVFVQNCSLYRFFFYPCSDSLMSTLQFLLFTSFLHGPPTSFLLFLLSSFFQPHLLLAFPPLFLFVTAVPATSCSSSFSSCPSFIPTLVL